ncbi:hypothetical protein B5F09_11710 [Erysipelatoclostridium sp. An173]|uniref:EpsG family protein n=1 Tax=Erysipelatoclostridium sp. An173 TaxID=1965571 RepID=UPI000B3A7E82|nr:EpsG family protein [Erysipelatoclostridium sp. An173]OUP73234.1 hypothetical protein B5F09_11710 [Erysipelatoclostridium sp. An173]
MSIYLTNILLIFILNFISKHIKNGKNIFLILSFLIMWSIVVFRWNIGVDYRNYNEIYFRVISSNFLESLQIIEPGYVIVIYLSNIITPNNPWFMHFLIGTITLAFFYLSIKKISTDYFLSVYIFISINFFYSMMNQERQFLAISIVSYGLYFLVYKEDKKMFVFLIMIAVLFHFSSIVCLIILLPNIINKFKFKKIIFFMTFLILSIIIFNLDNILSGTNYGRYFGSYYDNQLQLSVILNTIVRIIICIPIFYIYQLKKIKLNKYRSLFYMLFFMLFFQICTLFSSVFGRITTYFFTGIIYLLPIIVYQIKIIVNNKIVNKMILILIIMLLIPYHYVYFNLQSESMGINPYISIFDK